MFLEKSQNKLIEPRPDSNDCNFTGRNREIKEVISQLTSQSTRIVSLHGPPGFGKSKVTIAVGHDLSSKGKAVYRVELDEVYTKDQLVSSLLRFVSDQSLTHLEPVDFLLRVFSEIKDPVYFILDNADNLLEPEVKDGVIKLIKYILTESPSVTFLVATRESLEFSMLKLIGQKSVRIGPLDMLSSQNLVQKWLPEAFDADCRKIAQFCEHMPLAIRLFCTNISQNELPLNQAVDDFISLIKSDLSRLDDPEELKVEKLNCIIDSSLQRPSFQEKESYLSLSVIHGTFNVEVAAAVWGITTSDAERTLKTLRRKSLVDSSSQPGSYKVHKILRLFARQKGEREINEVLLSSKIRLLQFYISVFVELKERFLSGQSLSSFIDFYEKKQNIISSIIDGCQESSTRDSVFDALTQGVLFLDTVLWSDRDSFNKIYDTAITKAKKYGNNNTFKQLLLAKAFSEVTWGKEEVETMQLLHSTDDIKACSPDEQQGKHSCYLGIHKLANGQIKNGVEHLENCISYLKDTIDPSLKVLKVVTFQILSLYFESTNCLNRAVTFYENARDECKTRGNHDLLIIPRMTSKGLRIKDKKKVKQVNQPLVLEVCFLVAKAAKIFAPVETMKSVEDDVLEMQREINANLSANSKVGWFYLHRSVAGVLAEMTRYNEAIESIQTVIEIQKTTLHHRRVCGVNPSHQDRTDKISEDLGLYEHQEALAKNLFYLAVLQFRQKDYKASLQSQKCALQIREKLYGEPHADIADSCHELGIILRTLGEYEEAVHIHKRALCNRSQLSNENPLKEADSHHELGVTQCTKGDYPSAFDCHKKALKIRLKHLGKWHKDTASSYHELGITQWCLKEYDCALNSHKEALEILLKEVGEHHSTAADSYYEIGKTYFCLKNYHAAYQSHLDGLRSRLNMLGEQHCDTANSWYEIGLTLFTMEWYSSALKYHKRALKARQTLYEAQHSDILLSCHQAGMSYCHTGVEPAQIADSLFQMALVEWKLESYQSSLKAHKEALDIRLNHFGKNHIKTAESYFQLGLIQCDLGLYTEALNSHQEALAIRRKLFGDWHTETANSYLETGNTQIKYGDFDGALSSLENALQIRTNLLIKEQETLGEIHEDPPCWEFYGTGAEPKVIFLSYNQEVKEAVLQDNTSALQLYQCVSTVVREYSSNLQSHPEHLLERGLQNLKEQLIKKANTFCALGYGAEKNSTFPSAKVLHQRALNMRVVLFGEKHRDTANSYHALGSIESNMREFMVAFQLYQHALQIRRDLFGDNHPDVAISYHDLGVLHHQIGEFSNAVHFNELALKIRRKAFGEHHVLTASSYHNVGHMQCHIKYFSAALKSYQRALTIRREVFGESHPLIAKSLLEIEFTKVADYESAVGLD